MRVHHFCYYLTAWEGIKPRQEDYDTNKVVKCVKGDEPIKGFIRLSIDGVIMRVNEQNKAAFLDSLWAAMGRSLGERLQAQTAIVPIPSSAGTVGAAATYRTLRYAEAIAAASGGKVAAVDALRWKTEAEAAHKQKGFRTPEKRYDNLIVIANTALPILLFDDVITSGSSFIAAYWHLGEAGNAPREGIAVARATGIQEPKMFVSEVRDLEIPERLAF
jgi:hypothetical protein